MELRLLRTKRILKPRQDGTPGVRVKEVSPVALAGAGIGTRTLAIKSGDGLTFKDQADLTVEAVKSLIERTVSLVELRHSEGKNIPETKVAILDTIREMAEDAQNNLRLLSDHDDISVEYRRFLRLESQIAGVPIE
jgi:hypothetical protein